MPPHLNIAVVGAGIVGVSVAALLGKKGFSVTVFEAKSGLDEIGAGITSHPSAARIISTVIEPGAFEKVATQPERVVFRRYADSKILGSKKQPTTEGAACTGLLHRADLQKILYDAARQHGASVRFGSRIVNIDDTGAKPVLSIKDGPRAEYDLVIAADGVQSEIRGAVIPYSSSCVKMTDECVFRSVINVDKIKMFPEFGQYLTKEDQTIVLGPSKHLVLYPPIRNGSLLNLVWSSYLHKVASIEGWNKQTSYKEPQEDFSGFDPHVLRLLEHADDVSKWRVAEVRDLPTWRSKSGRVVLMGDAAHAMIPHAAQGSTQGIEDGAVLATLLSRIDNAGQVGLATEAYERLRRPRVAKVQESASANVKMFQMSDGPEQKARDEELKLGLETSGQDDRSGKDPKKAPFVSSAFRSWLHNTDVVQQAEQYPLFTKARL